MGVPIKELTLYIRLRKSITVPTGTEIKLGMIANLVCKPEFDESFKQFVLVSKEEATGKNILIDYIDIVRQLQTKYESLNVECFGDPQTLISFKSVAQKPRLLFAVIVWLILFIGSGLAIMNFHADVSMLKVHQNLYLYITGQEVDHPLLLQIPYSFGLGIGMALFFNRIFKKRINQEPDPLELEMYNYQTNIYEYSIAEKLGRENKDNENDV